MVRPIGRPKRSKLPIILTFLAGVLVGAILYRAGTTSAANGNQAVNVVVPSEKAKVAEATPAPVRTSQPSPLQVESISVPSDPSASYELIEWRRMSNGHREAITRRVGRSGMSYSRREIDCEGMRFRYLGEGGTLEEARSGTPDPDMGPLTPESISTYVSQHVCAK